MPRLKSGLYISGCQFDEVAQSSPTEPILDKTLLLVDILPVDPNPFGIEALLIADICSQNRIPSKWRTLSYSRKILCSERASIYETSSSCIKQKFTEQKFKEHTGSPSLMRVKEKGRNTTYVAGRS